MHGKENVIKEGTFVNKAIQEEPMRYFSATNLDGSPETCKKVGEAILKWLDSGKKTEGK